MALVSWAACKWNKMLKLFPCKLIRFYYYSIVEIFKGIFSELVAVYSDAEIFNLYQNICSMKHKYMHTASWNYNIILALAETESKYEEIKSERNFKLRILLAFCIWQIHASAARVCSVHSKTVFFVAYCCDCIVIKPTDKILWNIVISMAWLITFISEYYFMMV